MAGQTDAKRDMLSKVRRSLGVDTSNDAARRQSVSQRLADAPKGILPARGQLPVAERIALFRQQAEGVHATVEHLEDYDALPECVSRYLREKNLPAEIRVGGDMRLVRADWSSQPSLTLKHGASDGHDLAGLSHAFGAIAETGTLALTAGPDNPTTINFLPEYHLVVIDAGDIHGDMEALWDALRQAYGKGAMSRVINFITGPSRSADIEQTILLGAHGPRALHIMIVGKTPS